MDAPVPDPGPATPDTSDWTWVLSRPCPDCGFDPAVTRLADLPLALRSASRSYAAVLAGASVHHRPGPGVWSPLEYAAHVRDVCGVMTGRLGQILAGGAPGAAPVVFADWDQDAAAISGRYWAIDPAALAGELEQAFEDAATAFGAVRPEDADLAGTRSNGSPFTVASLGQYFLHDVTHHLWDVNS